MTTSPKGLSICEIVDENSHIQDKYLHFFAARSQNEAHDLVLRCFDELRQSGLTRNEIARRLKKKPEQITRWLGSPGNWTLETLSNLLLALGQVPEFSCRPIHSLNVQANSGRSGQHSVHITFGDSPVAMTNDSVTVEFSLVDRRRDENVAFS